MSQIVLAADSTSLILNGAAITDFGEGDFLTLTPVNPATAQVNSANGGVAISKRMDADVYDLVFRVQKFSPSDVLMNSHLKQATPVVFTGTLVENFKRNGVAGKDSWALDSGSATTRPTETRNNQDGNAVVEYTIRFRQAIRSI